MNDKTDKNQNISRRDALKKMGALTATAAHDERVIPSPYSPRLPVS